MHAVVCLVCHLCFAILTFWVAKHLLITDYICLCGTKVLNHKFRITNEVAFYGLDWNSSKIKDQAFDPTHAMQYLKYEPATGLFYL